MFKRRTILSGFVGLCAGAAVSLSAWSTQAGEYIGGWQSKYPTIKWGVISVETSVDTLKNQNEFAAYMGKELGVKVEVFTASEYAGIINALAGGQIQMGWLSASSYSSTWSDCKCVEPLVGAQDVQGGMGYNSVLIVKSGSPYKKFEDLKGKVVARNDPNSTSGFLIPTLNFLEMGKPVDKYFKSPLSGGHQQSIVGVLNGTYDGSFVWTSKNDGFGAIRKMVDKGLLKRDDIRVVWTSSLIPTPPVVIRSELPTAMKLDIEKFLIRLISKRPDLAEVVAQGKTLGLKRVYHEDYLPIVKAKALLKKMRKKK